MVGASILENSNANFNKTGLQPVSRPVLQILGFFQKVLKRCKKLFKNLTLQAEIRYKKQTSPQHQQIDYAGRQI